MSIDMRTVAKDIGDCVKKEISKTPVAADLPRLARRFILQRYQDSTLTEMEFTKDVQKDEIEEVIYRLICNIFSMLVPNQTIQPSIQVFKQEVNLQLHETLASFLIKHYGESAPLNRMLKTTNQSVVIAVLYHIREALMKYNISFKDVRGKWTIFFNCGPTGKVPCVTHRRQEQVYEMVDGKLILQQKFEWEVEIQFDGLQILEIMAVRVNLRSVSFDENDTRDKESIEKIMKQAIPPLSIGDLHIKLT